MNRIAENAGGLTGYAPVVRLARLREKYGCGGEIYASLEMLTPSGSGKDRAAFYVLERALADGRLRKGGAVAEITGGSWGVSLAMACAALGLRAYIIAPDDIDRGRRQMMELYGAEVLTAPAAGFVRAAAELMGRLRAREPGIFCPDQFKNADMCAPYRRRAEALLRALPEMDYFVAGVGSGATLTGFAEALKMRLPDCRIVAVEPAASPVLSGGSAGQHPLSGIGAGFVPEILNTYILDEVIRVRTPDALETARELARTEGILCSAASGAALCAAISVAARAEAAGRRVAVALTGWGERELELLRGGA